LVFNEWTTEVKSCYSAAELVELGEEGKEENPAGCVSYLHGGRLTLGSAGLQQRIQEAWSIWSMEAGQQKPCSTLGTLPAYRLVRS
jgi:hypothetical protein